MLENDVRLRPVYLALLSRLISRVTNRTVHIIRFAKAELPDRQPNEHMMYQFLESYFITE